MRVFKRILITHKILLYFTIFNFTEFLILNLIRKKDIKQMAYKQKVYMPIKTQKSSARYLSSVKLLLNKYHILFHKIQFLIINQAFQNKKKNTYMRMFKYSL